jgi:hypothetical protein
MAMRNRRTWWIVGVLLAWLLCAAVGGVWWFFYRPRHPAPTVQPAAESTESAPTDPF